MQCRSGELFKHEHTYFLLTCVELFLRSTGSSFWHAVFRTEDTAEFQKSAGGLPGTKGDVSLRL